MTNDIDILADVRVEHVAGLLAAFPADAYYLSEDAIRSAIAHRGQFDIIQPDSGLKVDVILPSGIEYDIHRLARRVAGRPTGTSQPVFFGSPDDVIVKKLEFHLEGGSDKHIRDIAGILKAGLQPVDLDYVERFANQIGNLDGWREAQRRAAKSSAG